MVVVLKNACYLIVEKGALLLSGLVILVLAGRWTGMEGLGRYTFVVSLASLMMPLLDIGLNSRIVKGIAGGNPESSVWRTYAIKIKLAAAPVAICLPILFGLWTGRDPEVIIGLFIFGLSSVAMSLGDLANAVFKGRERMGYSAWVTLLWNGLLLLGCWGALIWGWGLIGLTSAFLVARTFYAFLASSLSRLIYPPTAADLHTGWMADLLRKGILSFPASYFLLGLLNLSLVLVTLWGGNREGGQYALGQRLLAAMFIVASGGIEAVYPALSRRFFRNSNDFARPLIRATGALAIISILSSTVAYSLAEPAVSLLFGPVPGAVSIIRVMVWAVPPFALCALFHYALVASDRERSAFLWMSILTASGVVVNATGVWRWGMLGGGMTLIAWGTVCAIVLASLLWRSDRRSKTQD